MKKMKKLLIILMIIILDMFLVINVVNASNMSTANLYAVKECQTLLRYKGIDVKVTYVQYDNKDGNKYPAYCLDKTLPGVTAENPYSVDVKDAINDVGLWRRIINGYPYKSLEELGVANEEEAFTATKQAIYCYIHENNPEDYEGIGEEGNRTLLAMYNIIANAENSQETKMSTTIKINAIENEWKQDLNDRNYMYKEYRVSAYSTIKNYKVKLEKIEDALPEGIKITDNNNVEREEFNPKEVFKIMIPIKQMKKENKFKINIESEIKTKPVLYGTAPDSGLQDYAITLASYEDGTGSLKDIYPKNETKIIIEKQDEQTKEKLKGVMFEILNDKKETIYTNLKTNEQGVIEIDNLLPGTYFIKEIETIEGYELNDELVELQVNMNQIAKVIINNRRGEEPSVSISKTEKSIEQKKLPVTGM